MSFPKLPSVFWLAALFAATLSASAAVKVGEPFPDLAAQGLEGALPERAGRVVLVDFWATWCAPCKVSFPHYTALQKELGGRGLTVVAVSVDQKAPVYAEYLKRYQPGFATVRDGAQKLVAQVEPPSMPTCYLLDRAGVVRLVHAGFHGEADVKVLREEILRLLEAKP